MRGCARPPEAGAGRTGEVGRGSLDPPPPFLLPWPIPHSLPGAKVRVPWAQPESTEETVTVSPGRDGPRGPRGTRPTGAPLRPSRRPTGAPLRPSRRTSRSCRSGTRWRHLRGPRGQHSSAAWLRLRPQTGPGRQRCTLTLRPGARETSLLSELARIAGSGLRSPGNTPPARRQEAPLCPAGSVPGPGGKAGVQSEGWRVCPARRPLPTLGQRLRIYHPPLGPPRSAESGLAWTRGAGMSTPTLPGAPSRAGGRRGGRLGPRTQDTFQSKRRNGGCGTAHCSPINKY